jgi:hypothetical protein
MMAANNGLATYPGAFPAGVNGNATNGGPDAPNTVAISSILPGPNAALYGPATSGNTVPGTAPGANKFGPNDEVTRREMAYWIVKSLMDESAITAELNATGGNFATFADVPTTDPGWRYVEIMVRRGYTSGCAAGAARRYCPDYIATRKDLAVFMIRAKFNNVFASLLSGCSFGFVNGTTPGGTTTTVTPGLLIPPALTTNCGTTGDNFAAFVTGLPYFLDNPAQTGNDEYVYLQKMRELRITNGTSLGPNNDGRNGAYGRGTPNLPASQYAATTIPGSDASQLNGNLLRKQVAVFMVRGFFF